jgi:predicted enzyme related to lactoylglutathione lyase
MSKNYQIDLVEFPAASAEELKAVTKFFNSVFGWSFKEWGDDYNDTHDSGVTAGVNSGPEKEQTMPLAVIYAEALEATKDKVVAAGGKVTHEISSFPGGRRFAFTDPAGNQLAVWSDK